MERSSIDHINGSPTDKSMENPCLIRPSRLRELVEEWVDTTAALAGEYERGSSDEVGQLFAKKEQIEPQVYAGLARAERIEAAAIELLQKMQINVTGFGWLVDDFDERRFRSAVYDAEISDWEQCK